MSTSISRTSNVLLEHILDSLKPWPVAPRPFFEEAFGSWLGRVAARYQLSVGMLWETSTGLELPTLGRAGWILFPRVSGPPLDRLSKLARMGDGRLEAIQTPAEWITDQRYLAYCFRCLVLNEVDVTAPRWKRKWLDPTANYCRAHHRLVETIPASICRNVANFEAALRAISRYRSPRFSRDTKLRYQNY
ncbi:TniQ family protein [Paraburkholderia xenovorans]